MTSSLEALAAYIAWTLLLAGAVIVYRSSMVMTGQRTANAWTRGNDLQDPPLVKRIVDAFSNCLETGPLFFAVILMAHVSGQGNATDDLAMWYVVARVVQSVSHMISTSHMMVFLVRFPAFMAQVALLVWWLLLVTGLIQAGPH